MQFLVDKYKITSLSDLLFHKHIYKSIFPDLKNVEIDNINDYSNWPSMNELTEAFNKCSDTNELTILFDRLLEKKKLLPLEKDLRYQDISNILIFGPHGSGKHTLLNLLLEDMFDNHVHDIKKNIYKIEDNNSSSEEIEIYESEHHIIIDPTAGCLDKHIVHEIIAPYASKPIFNIRTNNYVPFRVIVINNAHKLSTYAQNALRCIMEKNNKLCKFILITTQIAGISEPLRSRCMPCAFTAPIEEDIYKLLYHICCVENIKIEYNILKTIIDKSDRNIKTCIWLLEEYSYGITNFDLAWIKKITSIAKIICAFNKNKYEKMTRRELVNKYLDTSIYKKYIEQAMLKKDKIKLDKIYNSILSDFPEIFHNKDNILYGEYITNKYNKYKSIVNVSYETFTTKYIHELCIDTVMTLDNFNTIKMLINKYNFKMKITDKTYDKQLINDVNDDYILQQILKKYKIKLQDINVIYKCNTHDEYLIFKYNDHIKSIKTYDEYVNNLEFNVHIYNAINNAKSFIFETIINNDTYEYIEDTLYSIFISNIEPHNMITILLDEIIKYSKGEAPDTDINPLLLIQLTMIFSEYDKMMNIGTRQVVQFKNMINQIFYHINKFCNM